LISNVRLGHATNSSSSHSIILKKNPPRYDECVDGEFGWGHFVCATPDAKGRYLKAMLKDNLQYEFGKDTASQVINAMFPNESDVDASDYVDHQSHIAFPIDRSSGKTDWKFVKEFYEYIVTNKAIAIYGGNDDGGPSGDENIEQGDKEIDLPGYQSFVTRKDESGYWTLFNRTTGAKIRMSFDGKTPVKNATPELVDIKITEVCDKGCPFCYQNSKPIGQHADWRVIQNIARALFSLNVFEVALGGGEPTLHPQFFDVLSEFATWKINPNFTTATLGWVTDETIKTLKACNSTFAYSVSAPRDVDELAALIKKHWEYSGGWVKPRAQVVLGVTSEQTFKEILQVAKKTYVPLTLLGYKTTGRGSAFKPYDYSDWWTHVKDVYGDWLGNLSIDTKLAVDWANGLKQMDVSELSYHTEEGKFSCYIDAIGGTISPSSFDSKVLPIDLKNWRLGEQIREEYSKF
jgi:hypothetical protein